MDLTRQRIYASLTLLSGLLVPLAAIWGISIDEPTAAAIGAILGSLGSAIGNYLARRNVDAPVSNLGLEE